MENVFLGIIALNALLSAAIIGGLAFGMRLLSRRLDDLEGEVEKDVLPRLREFTDVARKAADAAADARRRAVHVDVQVTKKTDHVGRLVGGTLDQVSGLVEDAADRVEDGMAAGAEKLEEPLVRSAAVLKGVQRGLEAFFNRR